jgi:hypothetical protein
MNRQNLSKQGEPPLIDQPNVDLEAEGARISSVYAQRQGAYRYSWFNQGHLFRVQQLEHDILAELRSRDMIHLHDKKILEGCYVLEKLRVFNTHYLGVIRPN